MRLCTSTTPGAQAKFASSFSSAKGEWAIVNTASAHAKSTRLASQLKRAETARVHPLVELAMRILITGANRGLGLEFVRQYLSRGERVIATTRHTNRAQALNHLAGEYPGHLTVLPLDAANPASIAELLRELQAMDVSLDLMIANAGVLISGERFGELSSEDMEQSFRVNTVGPVLLTQALLPLLANGKAPRAIYLSSILGSITQRDSFYSPSYCISKAALNMGVRLLSSVLAEKGVSAVCVHPGWVQTDMGGAKATLTAVVAVSDLVRLIDGFGAAHNGRFFMHDGSELPW